MTTTPDEATYQGPLLSAPDCPLMALGWRTIIRQFAAQDKVGLIHLPDEAKEAPLAGEVVAVSQNVHRVYGLRVGDVVLFPRHGGYVSTFDGKDYLILDRENILAVVRNDGA